MTPDTAARTAAAVLAAALPEPGPDAVYARLDARRAALTILGGAAALHGQPTEELVARARTRLADEAAQSGGEG